jgi:hypothetical protein
MKPMKGARVLTLLLPLAFAVACGSTVPAGRQAAALRESGLGESGLGGPTPTSGVPGAPALLSPSGTPGLAGPPGAAQGPTGSAVPDVGPSTGGPTRRSTAPLLIGYTTAHDLQRTSGALGLTGVDTGDVDAVVAALAADLNARGGLLGRPVRLLGHDFSSANAQTNRDGEQQRACTDFTQDHHVDVVIDTVLGAGEGVRACLAKAGVPLFVGAAYTFGDKELAGPIYSGSIMSVDEYVPALVAGLARGGWFTGWNTVNGTPSTTAPVKVGLMHFDDPTWNTYAKHWKQEAARLGYPIVDEVTYPHDTGTVASTTQNAVLKFRSEGITHVVNANILFYKGADTQGYHPRYEVDDTLVTPQLLTENETASQLRGSMGVGYMPIAEVDNPGDVTSATARCRTLMARAGQRPTGQLAEGVMQIACDGFFLLDALATAGGGLTTAQLNHGADVVGSSYTPVSTYTARLSARRHGGASSVRPFAYVEACGCFRYTGPPVPVQ